MSREYVISLPWPPSLNHYWRNHHGRMLLSRDGRQYRDEAALALKLAGVRSFGSARLAVEVEVRPPDRRRRDLDNLGKAVLDALTAGGVYDDDSQIDDLRIVRGPVTAGGEVVVVVRSKE